jgi:hypothetical protein
MGEHQGDKAAGTEEAEFPCQGMSELSRAEEIAGMDEKLNGSVRIH